MSQISPYLYYEDARGAVDFLCRAFGFTETMHMEAPDGRVTHAELRLGEGTVMLGEPGGDYRSPKSLSTSNAGVHVYVDDVDAHFEQARAEGATILSEPTDQEYGDRRYDCRDPEGQTWWFATAMSPTARGSEKALEHRSD